MSQLKMFSELLKRLIALSDTSDSSRFQDEALALAAESLRFDSAAWGVGVVEEGMPVIQGIHLFRQPVDMIANWDSIKQYDVLYQACFAAVGQVVFADRNGPPGSPPVHPLVEAHIDRYGLAHSAVSVFVDPLSGLFSSLSFYRSDPARPFLESERQFVGCVFEHLAEAWARYRLRRVGQPFERSHTRRAVALADSGGTLHAASPAFVCLIVEAWPDWKGPHLPRELTSVTRSPQTVGGLVVESMDHEALRHFSLRRRNRLDLLSARQREIAALVAGGMNYREIAEKLFLSPETVRNHIRNVYQICGAHGIAQLVRLLASDGEDDGSDEAG
jgi:DNA-binding CsgD family transcriptional regulator